MDKQEANNLVTRLIEIAQDNIKQAKALADEHGLTFTFSADDESYHLSDSYQGKAALLERDKEYYERFPEELEYLSGKWMSSGAYC